MSVSGKAGSKKHGRLHPVLIMLAMMLLAMALTHVIPAGRFLTADRHVVPGTYHSLAKMNGLGALLSPTPPKATDFPARASGLVGLFVAIPAGFTKEASLIFMVMFVGGMFGVLRSTGAVDAAIDRLLHLATGNVYLIAAGLMFLLACGSTFLGFISEYLAIIPLVLVLGQRMNLPNLFAPAVVCIGSMIGYAASVTNPIVLNVAQPLAGVPIFSGVGPRFAIFGVMFCVGVGHVFLYLRRLPKRYHIPDVALLTGRQVCVWAAVLLGGTALVIGTSLWSWGTLENAASFLCISVVLAMVGGLRPAAAADAFLEGMRSLLLAGVMIGLAGAVDVILQSSQILDTVVQGFAGLVHGHAPGAVASGIMAAEMLFDVLIHSTSAKAAVSLPVLTPMAHLAGVSGQVSVTALTIGGGLTNMVIPTNGLLLAFLAAAKVDYFEWIRFVTPLFLLLCAIGVAALYTMVECGL